MRHLKDPVDRKYPSNRKRGTVVLADTLWYGHHATYFVSMCRALIAQGFRVMALCPEPDECKRLLANICEEGTDLDESICFETITHGRSYFPKFDHDPISTILRWRRVAKTLKSLQKSSGWTPDFVFFPWLDSFLRFGFASTLPSILGVPWSGLYFRNYHLISDFRPLAGLRHLLKGDQLLRNSRCRVVGQLDDRPDEVMLNAFNVKPVLFPDITDETSGNAPSTLSKEIKALSKGRTILGLISLEPRKGVMEILRIAHASADKPWFFVLNGPFEEEWFSSEDLAFIQALQQDITDGKIDHIFLDTTGNRIPDGYEYNSLIQTFDILLSVYPGYQCSSNALTKAAIFEKMVLVAKGGCIGKRVEDFELGSSIDPDDVPNGILTIENLAAGKDPTGLKLNPQFKEYHSLHSHERLEEQLAYVFEAATATNTSKAKDPAELIFPGPELAT